MMRAESNKIWKPIQECNGVYAASNTGRIKRIVRGSRQLRLSGKPLRPVKLADGYLRLCLHYEGRQYNRLVHVLIVEAFLGPRPSGYQVNHKNGNKADNRIHNLEYVTPSENTQHAHDTGLAKRYIGESNGRCVLTAQQVINIRVRRAKGELGVVLAAEYGVTAGTICAVYRRRNWQHIA